MREAGRVRRPSRARGGVVFKLLFLLAALVAAAALAWMLFLPVLLTQALRQRTGCDATVERFVVNPLTGDVDLRGLVLSNPPGFPAGAFVELRAFTAHADVMSLLSERPVFDEVTVDLAGITLAKRADGLTNAEAFQTALDGTSAPKSAAATASSAVPAPTTESPPAAGTAPSGGLLIRRLTVRVEKVTLADYTGATPKIRTIEAPVDRTYENVTDLDGLLGAPALGEFAPLGTIAERLVPGVLGRSLRDLARSGREMLQETGRTAEEKVRGLFDTLEESRKP